MNFKTIFAVFVIIGIGVMLLRTDSGRRYMSNIGNLFSGLFSAGGSGWVGTGGGGRFEMTMVADRSAFLGQSYQVQNSSVSSAGLIDTPLVVGGVEMRKENIEIELDLSDAKGTFEYTVAGTLRFQGTVSEIGVDDNSYSSPEGSLKVSFELVPTRFILTGLSERKITFGSVTGSIARLNTDGSIKSTEELTSEKVEIYRFEGFVVLDNTTIKMDGSADSVKGTGLQSSFNW